jgi:chromate transporter
MKKLSYFKLFLIFIKTGCFAFGGGLAMIPFITKDLLKTSSITKEEIDEALIICQSCPGVFAGNFSFYLGYKLKGFLGGLLALLGVIFPSIVFIMIVLLIFTNIRDYEIVKSIFKGVRVFICVIILNISIKYIKDEKNRNIIFFLITLTCFFLSLLTKISLFFMILGVIVIGLLSLKLEKKEEKHD